MFKLVAVDDGGGAWRPAMKRSDSPVKVLNPGAKRLWRVYDERGRATADVLSTADETLAAGERLHLHHHARPDVARTRRRPGRVDELLVAGGRRRRDRRRRRAATSPTCRAAGAGRRRRRASTPASAGWSTRTRTTCRSPTTSSPSSTPCSPASTSAS